MKNHYSELQWDDIVFLHKNKSYGAYELRSSYSKRLFTILALVFITFWTLIALASGDTNNMNISSKKEKKKRDEEFTPVIMPNKMAAAPTQSVNASKVKGRTLGYKIEEETNPIQEGATKPQENSEDENSNPSESNHTNGNGYSDGENSGNEITSELALDTALVDFPELDPEFPGGELQRIKFLQQEIQYPTKAIRFGRQGVITISAIVEKDGTISSIKVLGKNHFQELADEAVRVVMKMPKWKPAELNKKKVRCAIIMNVKFDLPEEEE